MSVLCLTGPSASGKSLAALQIARYLRDERDAGVECEIISVDSAQVYRGLDIGTAKPDAQTRALVPHHLLDILDPSQTYSAARFCEDAQRLIGEIRARGHLPILCGGTLLYYRALFFGLDAAPPSDPAIRAAIAAQAQQSGWPALHAELARHDPASAARLNPNDAQRISRALEVWRQFARPYSGFLQQREDGRRAAPASYRLVSLEPSERSWLSERIALRTAAMLEAGFIAEVQRLRQRSDLHEGLSALRSVGYRQIWQMLAGDFPAAQLPERINAATRQLAKRQMTWLRSWPWRQILACDDAAALAAALQRLGTDLLSIALSSRHRP